MNLLRVSISIRTRSAYAIWLSEVGNAQSAFRPGMTGWSKVSAERKREYERKAMSMGRFVTTRSLFREALASGTSDPSSLHQLDILQAPAGPRKYRELSPKQRLKWRQEAMRINRKAMRRRPRISARTLFAYRRQGKFLGLADFNSQFAAADREALSAEADALNASLVRGFPRFVAERLRRSTGAGQLGKAARAWRALSQSQRAPYLSPPSREAVAVLNHCMGSRRMARLKNVSTRETNLRQGVRLKKTVRDVRHVLAQLRARVQRPQKKVVSKHLARSRR